MKDKREVKKSACPLFLDLKRHAQMLDLDTDFDFPKSNRWLWRKINPIKTNLKNAGILAEYDQHTRPREILLRNLEEIDGTNVTVGTVGEYTSQQRHYDQGNEDIPI